MKASNGVSKGKGEVASEGSAAVLQSQPEQQGKISEGNSEDSLSTEGNLNAQPGALGNVVRPRL